MKCQGKMQLLAPSPQHTTTIKFLVPLPRKISFGRKNFRPVTCTPCDIYNTKLFLNAFLSCDIREHHLLQFRFLHRILVLIKRFSCKMLRKSGDSSNFLTSDKLRTFILEISTHSQTFVTVNPPKTPIRNRPASCPFQVPTLYFQTACICTNLKLHVKVVFKTKNFIISKTN